MREPFVISETTKIDVDKLLDVFGVPEPGKTIKYSEVEEALGIQKGQTRFRTVTVSWRKKLFRDHNVVIDTIKNVGFFALSSTDRVYHANKKAGFGSRMMMRASYIARKTDSASLGEEEKRLHEKLVSIPIRLRLAEKTAPKDLPY